MLRPCDAGVEMECGAWRLSLQSGYETGVWRDGHS